jgi:predicted transcriptional regulator
VPDDVVEELKRIAPLLGVSGYQSLIQAYIGQGLRQDVERLAQRPEIERFIENLRRHGVAEEVIDSAVAELCSIGPS